MCIAMVIGRFTSDQIGQCLGGGAEEGAKKRTKPFSSTNKSNTEPQVKIAGNGTAPQRSAVPRAPMHPATTSMYTTHVQVRILCGIKLNPTEQGARRSLEITAHNLKEGLRICDIVV